MLGQIACTVDGADDADRKSPLFTEQDAERDLHHIGATQGGHSWRVKL